MLVAVVIQCDRLEFTFTAFNFLQLNNIYIYQHGMHIWGCVILNNNMEDIYCISGIRDKGILVNITVSLLKIK